MSEYPETYEELWNDSKRQYEANFGVIKSTNRKKVRLLMK